jgi:hypothetical protein|tara:strand:+ start:1926 stop:2102 length:177 start_codon:yes stop_codon:yes gene_type:complete
MTEDPKYLPENLRLKMSIDNTPGLTTPEKSSFEYFGVEPQEGDKEIVKNITMHLQTLI